MAFLQGFQYFVGISHAEGIGITLIEFNKRRSCLGFGISDLVIQIAESIALHSAFYKTSGVFGYFRPASVKLA